MFMLVFQNTYIIYMDKSIAEYYQIVLYLKALYTLHNTVMYTHKSSEMLVFTLK